MDQSRSDSYFHEILAEFHFPIFDLLEILADGQAIQQIFILTTEYCTHILFTPTYFYNFFSNVNCPRLERGRLGSAVSEAGY